MSFDAAIWMRCQKLRRHYYIRYLCIAIQNKSSTHYLLLIDWSMFTFTGCSLFITFLLSILSCKWNAVNSFSIHFSSIFFLSIWIFVNTLRNECFSQREVPHILKVSRKKYSLNFVQLICRVRKCMNMQCM